jgi:hypothetical protein
MTTLTNFFKESDSSLGVFYPKHYVIGTFPNFEKTKEAAQALRRAGFAEDEVLAVAGSEVFSYFAEFRANSGLWASAMTTLSRAFGTEQVFADDDVELARSGAGFIAVHSPDEATTQRIKDLLEPFQPRALHWYQSGGVQSLI